MTEPPDPGLIDQMQRVLGGAGTALAASLAGRAMWHAGEVRAKRRPVLCWDTLWELPTAIGMAIVGEGVGNYFELSDTGTVALIAACSYLGPRGLGAMLDRWLDRRSR